MNNNTWVSLFGFVAGAALFLWKEHQAYTPDVLPWALLLLCPLIHLYMHRGNGKHGVHRGHGDQGGKGVRPGRHDTDEGKVGEKGA